MDFANLPCKLSADVVVVGGGPSGMCAAIAAARQGVSVIMVEKGNCAGGMATQGLVGPFMTCYDKEGKEQVIRGLFSEIVDELVARGYAIHPSQCRAGTGFVSWIIVGHDHCTPFEAEGLKLVADDMLTKAGVKVLYHTNFLEPIVEDGAITGIVVASKRGIERIGAKVVVDCTGDADVAYRAGVECELGNEALGKMQPASMFFHIANVDSDVLDEDVRSKMHTFHRKDGCNYRSLYWSVAKAKEAGEWPIEYRVAMGFFRLPKKGEWAINTSRIMHIDATDNESLTRAEIEGRIQAEQLFKCIKKYVAGCENATLKATGAHVGIRETRHIKGEVRLMVDDLLNCEIPEDAILVCANSVDVHGRYGPGSNEYTAINGNYYGVPYRCMIPMGVENLLVSGRCVSAESDAAGAIRVMPPCMAMGQAAGTAAALSLKEGCSVRTLDHKKLQTQLRADGAYIPE